MNNFTHVPPGFRFHPTDEELVDYYLRRKINSRRIDLDVIKDVDLYKIEPWDLIELCRIGTEEQNEWYFFSHKDKKYPTGTRTNRATSAGFWKATGRDKGIYSKHDLIGMRKTLVFYKGRAPNGLKSDWIMHEYRLETEENGAPQEEGWVVCRVFKKRIATTHRLMTEHDSPIWYEDRHVSFMPENILDSPNHSNLSYNYPNHNNSDNHNNSNNHTYSCKKELTTISQQYDIHHGFLQLPLLLESPKMGHTPQAASFGPGLNTNPTINHLQTAHEQAHPGGDHDQVMDWRVLDKFVASQLSHEEISKERENAFSVCEDENIRIAGDLSMVEMAQENASTSSGSCHVDLWK